MHLYAADGSMAGSMDCGCFMPETQVAGDNLPIVQLRPGDSVDTLTDAERGIRSDYYYWSMSQEPHTTGSELDLITGCSR